MDLPVKTRIAANIEAFGLFALRYGLVFILLWIGGMKFTAFEAEAIKPPLKAASFSAGSTAFSICPRFPDCLGARKSRSRL